MPQSTLNGVKREIIPGAHCEIPLANAFPKKGNPGDKHQKSGHVP